ncbi:IS66 Orf2 like protein [Enhygromyxa salina]|uniref:IS66 Orf2 like protein n=1 Tax=Enhygromyxa salina TaxID=215803 RepID=A0A2S9YAP4_9BACT|nr:IS66 family insertion sequence element accessory protein TnpB [Enhygromyxa salina]PRQ02180.1 IS66 Orf2 like protein [Enhygromyxa salina]
MLSLPPSVRIYFALDPVDLRKGFDGLCNVTRSLLAEDPMSGHLFVFINRRGNRAKILFWDRTGWVIYYKRIERGTFRAPKRPGLGEVKVEVEAAELMLILEGIELAGSRRRSRWVPEKKTVTLRC